MGGVAWNVFRLLGDFLHLGGMLQGLLAVWSAGSVEGFSKKTQVLYQLVFVSRYLDLFTVTQNWYLILFKVTYNLLTAFMLSSFSFLWQTYNAEADSCNLLLIVPPAAAATYLVSVGSSFRDEMWTFSEFLEPVALVPQYIMCYRATRVRPGAVLYTLCVGGYRLLYILNWIYKRYMWQGAYHDYTSWLGGILEAVLFVDFVMRISKRKDVQSELEASALGRLLLQVDSGAGKLSEIVEMRALGRRVPFGLTGHGAKEGKKEWDAGDKLTDEESCGLITLGGDGDMD